MENILYDQITMLSFLLIFLIKKNYTQQKYDPNWNIYVNGIKVIPSTWDTLFIKIPVDVGTNIIEFKYAPYDIYYGLVYGFALVFVTSIFIYYNSIYCQSELF